MARLFHLVALLLAMALCGAAPVAAPTMPGTGTIVTRTLPNGLKIVIWPDHDIPNVALSIWFRVGSRNEYPGINGLAHYIEHMMFIGTRARGLGEFDRAVEAWGGSANAYTSNDVTVYQDWFPKELMETVFELESDRMVNLDFDFDMGSSELAEISWERHSSVDNNDIGALTEQMYAAAYTAHPYQFPVLGWRSDLEGPWGSEFPWAWDLVPFYKTYYAPNNAVMFVVGDVQPEAVFALAEKYFAKIPRQPAPKPLTTVEPEQHGERRLVLEKADAQTPILALAYHVGNAKHEDAVTTELLNAILADGESSRLHQRLVEQEQVAIAVGSNLEQGLDPGLLLFYAVLPPGGDAAKVEALFNEELARIAREPVSAAELAKARKQQQVAFWRALATISGKAQALGTFEIFEDDYRRLFDAPTRVEAVDAARLQAVAARVLRISNRTVGLLQPVAGAAADAAQE